MSSMQVDTRERGFSYACDAPLDMRMDPTRELDAREVVNEWDERQPLPRCCANWARSATPARSPAAIVRARARGVDRDDERARRHRHRGGPRAGAVRAAGIPAKRTFQAIRIAVNDELGQLDAALPLAWALLGRKAVLQGFPSTA